MPNMTTTTAVKLAGKHKIRTSKGIEAGPLMADQQGVYVEAKRKMLTRSHPGRYYLFNWPDVTGYTMGAPAPRQFGGSTTNGHHTQLEIRTATNVYSWELPYGQAIITSRIGRWLAQVSPT